MFHDEDDKSLMNKRVVRVFKVLFQAIFKGGGQIKGNRDNFIMAEMISNSEMIGEEASIPAIKGDISHYKLSHICPRGY